MADAQVCRERPHLRGGGFLAARPGGGPRDPHLDKTSGPAPGRPPRPVHRHIVRKVSARRGDSERAVRDVQRGARRRDPAAPVRFVSGRRLGALLAGEHLQADGDPRGEEDPRRDRGRAADREGSPAGPDRREANLETRSRGTVPEHVLERRHERRLLEQIPTGAEALQRHGRVRGRGDDLAVRRKRAHAPTTRRSGGRDEPLPHGSTAGRGRVNDRSVRLVGRAGLRALRLRHLSDQEPRHGLMRRRRRRRDVAGRRSHGPRTLRLVREPARAAEPDDVPAPGGGGVGHVSVHVVAAATMRPWKSHTGSTSSRNNYPLPRRAGQLGSVCPGRAHHAQ
mmetsp:Transcript_11464/g.35326  ORF Transcript_11464/g.35326 Transcript_11464/m.35326 type:complete len:338 (-) Transcript_11464:440-1453(-)